MFTNRYKHHGDNLVFELLNELVLEDSEPWNKLWPKAVELIHSISPKRKIIVGSNRWNSVDELKNLTFGDVYLSAIKDVCGDFTKSIEITSNVLKEMYK